MAAVAAKINRRTLHGWKGCRRLNSRCPRICAPLRQMPPDGEKPASFPQLCPTARPTPRQRVFPVRDACAGTTLGSGLISRAWRLVSATSLGRQARSTSPKPSQVERADGAHLIRPDMRRAHSPKGSGIEHSDFTGEVKVEPIAVTHRAEEPDSKTRRPQKAQRQSELIKDVAEMAIVGTFLRGLCVTSVISVSKPVLLLSLRDLRAPRYYL